MTVQMSYAGGAPQLALTGNIGAADSSFVASTGGTASGYPDGSLGDFVVLIGGGEKVLCSARSGTTFTVALGGRGYDGTSAAAWSSGAVVEHVWDAVSAQAASDHVNDKLHTHAFQDTANTFATDQTFSTKVFVGATDAVSKVRVDTTGSAIDLHGLTVFNSPNVGFHALQLVTNWGNGLGGTPLYVANASGELFGINNKGCLRFGAANLAGVTAASANTGASGAPPAQVVGYLIVDLNGTDRKIPYYAT